MIELTNMDQRGAKKKSEETFQELLPEGLDSDHHDFLSIKDQAKKQYIGYFWYHLKSDHPRKEAFIYDFFIHDSHRSKGYGKASLQALEKHMKEENVMKLTLHVFAHNERAVHLYHKLQYKTTDLVMSKTLQREGP